MVLEPPADRDLAAQAQRDTWSPEGAPRGLDASSPLRGAAPLDTKRRLEEQAPLCKQFQSEENMAIHFSQLSLHNDHPYCSPPRPLPPPRNPGSELLLWRYPGNLIPDTLRLLRLGAIPTPHQLATPAGEVRKLSVDPGTPT